MALKPVTPFALPDLAQVGQFIQRLDSTLLKLDATTVRIERKLAAIEQSLRALQVEDEADADR